MKNKKILEARPTLSVIRSILKMRKYKALFIAIVVASCLSSLFAGVGIGIFIPLIELLNNKGISQNASGFQEKIVSILSFFRLSPNLGVFIGIIFFCLLLQALLELTRSVLTAKLRDDLTKDLRDRSFHNLMYISLQFYHNQKVGRLTSILGDEALRGAIAVYSFSKYISVLSIILVYMSILFAISWKATLIALALSVVSVFAVRRLVRLSEKLGQRKGDHKSLITSFCLENLSNYFLISIFNTQENTKESFFGLTDEIRHNLRKLSFYNSLIEFTTAMIRVSTVCILIFFMHGVLRLSIGYLATVLLVISQMAPRINELNVAAQTFFENLPGLRSIYSLSQMDGKPYLKNGNAALDEFRSYIEFRDVFFAYSSDKAVLRNINLRIEKGKTTAIIGASGSGKSTLIALIPRFYDPDKGEIMVDGNSLKSLDMFKWRNKIGFISQETFVYNDSIRSNLLIAKEDACDDEIFRAVRLAHLEEFILSLPEKWDTILGDRGLKLSGGQRQRIAIARVFLKNPEILILDEATSALDNISERLIQQSIDELSKSRSVIMIAHRLSTIKNADKIFVLEQGNIVEEGCPDELIRSGVHYNKYLFATKGQDNQDKQI